MIKIKPLITITLLIAFCTILNAAFLRDTPYQITQPDGTVIDAFLTGDEFHRWIHTADGYTIIQDPVTGYYTWAREENGKLVSTGKPIHTTYARSAGVRQNENISEQRYNEIRESMPDLNPPGINDPRMSSEGIVNQLVIFVRFADQPEFQDGHLAYYESIFNTNQLGSLKYYYEKASYGLFTVNSHFIPIQETNELVSYQSSFTRTQFEPYNADTNPEGYIDIADERARRQLFIRETLLAVADQVPANLNIDNDNDGFIDNITFIIRGNSWVLETLLWHHMTWNVENWIDMTINGKTPTRYNVKYPILCCRRHYSYRYTYYST